jgi:hypothetical protein
VLHITWNSYSFYTYPFLTNDLHAFSHEQQCLTLKKIEKLLLSFYNHNFFFLFLLFLHMIWNVTLLLFLSTLRIYQYLLNRTEGRKGKKSFVIGLWCSRRLEFLLRILLSCNKYECVFLVNKIWLFVTDISITIYLRHFREENEITSIIYCLRIFLRLWMIFGFCGKRFDCKIIKTDVFELQIERFSNIE